MKHKNMYPVETVVVVRTKQFYTWQQSLCVFKVSVDFLVNTDELFECCQQVLVPGIIGVEVP